MTRNEALRTLEFHARTLQLGWMREAVEALKYPERTERSSAKTYTTWKLVLESLELQDGASFNVRVKDGLTETFWHALSELFHTTREHEEQAKRIEERNATLSSKDESIQHAALEMLLGATAEYRSTFMAGVRFALARNAVETTAVDRLLDEIDEVANFPPDGAEVGRKVRLHNIRDKIAIFRKRSAVEPAAPQCQPTLTVCPTCGNDMRKCVGFMRQPEKASGVSMEACGCSRRADGFKIWCGKHWAERDSKNGGAEHG